MEGYFLHIASKLDQIRLREDQGKFDIVRELKSWDLWRAVIAECMATMLFVLIGTMSAMDIDTDQTQNKTLLDDPTIPVLDLSSKYIRIAFTFGLMITVCIQMIGHVSGGHMNPAVTIAMAVAMEISPSRALFYVFAQCIGGILGSLLLQGLTPERLHSNLGVTAVNNEVIEGQGFVCEALLTFILVLSIFGCTDSNRPSFGSHAVGIGFTITVLHLAAIPFTGASMNPARSLASAVISESYSHHWIYWAGPVTGGILAALAYKHVLDPYRKCLSYEEAAKQMLYDEDMICVPKRYFLDYYNKMEKYTHDSYSIHL